jgi:hypothetical protein
MSHRFVELRAAAAPHVDIREPQTAVQFEIECSAEVRIRVFHGADVEALTRLVGALTGRRAC